MHIPVRLPPPTLDPSKETFNTRNVSANNVATAFFLIKNWIPSFVPLHLSVQLLLESGHQIL
jgi:hypothetical protein